MFGKCRLTQLVEKQISIKCFIRDSLKYSGTFKLLFFPVVHCAKVTERESKNIEEVSVCVCVLFLLAAEPSKVIRTWLKMPALLRKIAYARDGISTCTVFQTQSCSAC